MDAHERSMSLQRTNCTADNAGYRKLQLATDSNMRPPLSRIAPAYAGWRLTKNSIEPITTSTAPKKRFCRRIARGSRR